VNGEQAGVLRAMRIEPGVLWSALAVAAGYYLAARLGFVFTLQPHPISTRC
jgi:hypothetical protein